MERLTGWDKQKLYAHVLKCFEGDGCPDMNTTKCDFCEHNIAIYNRLAAYEDTGYSPEDVVKILAGVDELYKLCLADDFQRILAAQREGRLVELPCKIGARIYDANGIYDKVIQRVASEEDMLTKIIPGWGKRYFATSEEAKAVLGEVESHE